MTGFLDHLIAEMQALERSLERDPRFIKLRELQRVHAIYEAQPEADSPAPQQPREITPRRRPTPREMSPATRRVVDTAREVLRGRKDPMPLRELYHEISEIRGVPIGGNEPINNLSAMLYRYGFEAVGRMGWRVRQHADAADTTNSEPNDPEPDPASLFPTPALNSFPSEIHGAATH